jgi:AcrR family transcriptional regulator
LRAAARLSSVEGLEGLSIATLAEHVGMSKSGLFAHFRSKEDLQLETIDAAAEVFDEEVIRPALAAPPGVARLRSLADRFLSHVERKVFPGGCFFAATAAEVDGHPGAVRDRIAAVVRSWMELLVRTVREAQSAGEILVEEEPIQIAFEVNAMLVGANSSFLLEGDPAVLSRARAGVERVLAAALVGEAARAKPLRGSRRRGGG